MYILLIAVTAISLAIAAGLAIALVKLVGDDRRRSEARVAALATMSAMTAAPVSRLQRSAETAPAAAAAISSPVVRAAAPRVHPQPRLDDLEIRRAEPVAVGDLFAEKEHGSPWGRRVAVMGALAAVVAAIGFAVVSMSDRKTPAPARAAVATPATAEPVPLELTSLRHLQQAQSLTVTGLVQNPRTGAPLSHVVVTAFAFGPDGTFLSSSRAPLDFTTLAPGDESPFVVTVPVTGVVSRYRIGFRAEDGGVIAHVDKRAPEALAGLR